MRLRTSIRGPKSPTEHDRPSWSVAGPSRVEAALCCRALVSNTVSPGLGKRVSALSAALRPSAADELGRYGGRALLRGRRILDVGCGDGRLALGAARYAQEVIGLDPDPEAIRSAKQRAREAGIRNARFVVGAGQELAFPDGRFDVVILSWTL